MPRKPVFFWCVAALGTGLLLCYGAAGVALWRHARESKDYGWMRGKQGDSWYVTAALGGNAKLLRVGDRILTFEGQEGPDWVVNRLVYLVPAGGAVHLTLRRDGNLLDVAVPVQPVRAPLDWAVPVVYVCSLVCFGVAMLMGLMKPADRTVQYGSLTFLTLAALLLSKALVQVYWMLDGWGMALYAGLALADPLPIATGYLFAARFPDPSARSSGWKRLGILICIVVAAEWVLLFPDHIASGLDPRATVAAFRLFDLPFRIMAAIPHAFWKLVQLFLCLTIGAVLLCNYRTVRQPDLKRRIRWMVFGIVVALVPTALLYLGTVLHALTGIGIPLNSLWFGRGELLANAFLGVVCSVTVAYGVLRHRVLDMHVVVRRSIQYLFTKRVLQALIFLPLAVLALRALLNPRLTVREALFGTWFQLAVAATAAVGLILRRRLLIAIDRRFFREDYDHELILRALIQDIKERDSISEICQQVSLKIESALHPRRILLFYRNHARGDFALGHSSNGTEPELRLSADLPILRTLEDTGYPQDVPLSGTRADEAEYLEKLGVCLLAPVTGADHRLVGVLMLGEKRSESPYTGSDRDLLQDIAAQIGMVYENICLRESARREAHIKRNVLARLDGAEINLLKECPRCSACFDRSSVECPTDGRSLRLTLPVDRTVDGVYRLEQRVGTGAMGAVYRATDLRLGRTVAVKLMVGSLFGNRSALRRFEREARAVARLSHPNIVAIHDFGGVGEDGAYLVMELVEGATLRAELRGTGALDPKIAAGRIDQLLEGLSAAHARGVVHRDLKPENLIVSHLAGGGELVKILDFGLAKITRGETEDAATEQASLTIAGTTVGTMGYMSPEQLLGETVDDRTDTFAVGVLVIECLTGRRPFAGLSFEELLHSILHQPAELAGDGPEIRRLNQVLARCLARTRAQRARVADIRQELVAAVRDCPPLAGAESTFMEQSTIDGTRHLI